MELELFQNLKMFTFHICYFYSGHINNLYNTTFWTLVQKGGLTTTQAEERLSVWSIKVLFV